MLFCSKLASLKFRGRPGCFLIDQVENNASITRRRPCANRAEVYFQRFERLSEFRRYGHNARDRSRANNSTAATQINTGGAIIKRYQSCELAAADLPIHDVRTAWRIGTRRFDQHCSRKHSLTQSSSASHGLCSSFVRLWRQVGSPSPIPKHSHKRGQHYKNIGKFAHYFSPNCFSQINAC